ncbi:MAG: ATP-binding cassette domain-containing protein [Candidatus Altiarchaeota archaeon]|nr:ATP-binding cassette domain-containing protein [Candidatus Altiarchaeota archaeon]
MSVISTKKLVKKFNGLTAVNGVDLSIEEGEIFGLLGPNGAGKTTTISMLCTILKPTSGTATVNGYDVISDQEAVRKSIGIAFQDPSLDHKLTGRENLRVHMGLYGVPKDERKKRMEEVLKLVQLTNRADEPTQNYSGGMKRRLEIARSLLHYPKVLFLDEPTLGLDPQTRRHLWEYIQNLAKKEKITILLTTHYMEEADLLCNRIAIIDEGKIVVIGTPDELKEKVGGDTIRIKCGNPKKLASSVKGKVQKDEVLIVTDKAEKLLPKIFKTADTKGIEIFSARIDRPSLEDVFLKFTGKEMRRETGSFKDIMKRRMRSR